MGQKVIFSGGKKAPRKKDPPSGRERARLRHRGADGGRGLREERGAERRAGAEEQAGLWRGGGWVGGRGLRNCFSSVEGATLKGLWDMLFIPLFFFALL